MYSDGKILIAKAGEESIYIYPKMANRHGLIAGATGTGKTVSLKVLAESFSDCGVPVFLADAKGDLAGMCDPGTSNENVTDRIQSMGLDQLGFDFKKYPVNFWDVYEEKGLPLRTTISEMGPMLLSRIMGLNDTQSDIMTMLFKIADDEGLLLIDTKDLRAMIQHVGENTSDYTLTYGNVTKQSLGAITRALVALEAEGAERFFMETALNIKDWFAKDSNGQGMIQILDCQKLMQNPTMYATFLLWMLSELFEILPEAGDLDKPRLVFFFDEAHMLFSNAPKVLIEKVEQVVKLIRSKGVGVFFITQNPSDIPDGVLAQLGNKIQHALRAYTPSEQKAVKAAAQSYRENPAFDTYTELLELAVGHALISVLDEDGIPTMVQHGKVLPPQSFMGAIDDARRNQVINNSDLYLKYTETFDRDSAYEFLQRKSAADAEAAAEAAAAAAAEKQAEKDRIKAEKEAEKAAAAAEKAAQKQAEKEAREAEKAALAAEKAAQKAKEQEEKAKKRVAKSIGNSVAGTIGREVGNSLGKTVGGSFGKKVGGNLGASLGRGIIGTFLKM